MLDLVMLLFTVGENSQQTSKGTVLLFKDHSYPFPPIPKKVSIYYTKMCSRYLHTLENCGVSTMNQVMAERRGKHFMGL